MTETQKAAMQQVLALLVDAQMHHYALKHNETDAIVTALRAALAEPEPEPVAWMFQHDETGRMNYVSNDGVNSPERFIATNPRYALVCALYTTPPARRPLTDAEIGYLWRAVCDKKTRCTTGELVRAFARAIERAHGIGGNDE